MTGFQAGDSEAIYHLTGGTLTDGTRHADRSKVIAKDLVLQELYSMNPIR